MHCGLLYGKYSLGLNEYIDVNWVTRNDEMNLISGYVSP